MGDIAYQNKDIASKVLAENLKNKSFEVYGIHLPAIKEVLPTSLPEIAANELRIDNIFLLEDESLAIVDYESSYKPEDKIKYINYIARVLKKLFPSRKDLRIRMIVLYTADVEKAEAVLDTGSLRLEVEQGFLTAIPTGQVYERIRKKIQAGVALDQKELMELIILPLTVKGKAAQQELLGRTVELAKGLPDERQQVFALSGILVFSDKIIRRDEAEYIRRWIMLTQVGRLFEEEKIEAVRKAIAETEERVTRRVTQENMENVARKLKQGNIAREKIMEFTGLSGEAIDKL